jgi:hypothetical protein
MAIRCFCGTFPQNFGFVFSHVLRQQNNPLRDILQTGAVQRAITQNIHDEGHVLWPRGTSLRVLFLNGDATLRQTVFNTAKIWCSFANISFELVTAGAAEIRVLFDDRLISDSHIGQNALLITNQSEPTMRYGSIVRGSTEDFKSTILHEFGHALGLGHEHQSPAARIQWNEHEVYQYYRPNPLPPQWNEEEFRQRIRFDVLNVYRTAHSRTTFFDSESIMLYSFPARLTLNNVEFPPNRKLSRYDKIFIACLYPGRRYARFNFQTSTCLHPTDDSFQFLMASNRDIFAVRKRNGASQKTEIHILSAASNYQQWALQTGTCLHPTDDSFQFLIAPNRDIVAVRKRNGGSNSTEIHILSAASNYQQWALQTGTCLHPTDDSFQFLIAPNRDIVAIRKRNGDSNSTEIHILSAASNYQQWALQTGTCLHPTDDSFHFLMASNRDIFAVRKRNGASETTEIHILSAASNYQQWALQVSTCLHCTDNSFEFAIAPNNDIAAIRKSGGESNKTEIHIMSNE